MADKQVGRLAIPELSSVGTPSSGFQYLYAKSDGYIYGKNSAGTETLLSNAASTSTLQTSYDASVTAGAARISLGNTSPVILRKANTSGITNVISFEDGSGNDYGYIAYDSSKWGPSIDMGETLTMYGHGGFVRVPAIQAKRSAGTHTSPTALPTATEVIAIRALTHNGTDYIQNGKATFYTSEAQTSSNQGIEFKVEVTKNSTTTKYVGCTVTNDGNMKVAGNFIARNTYKVPFILYTIPSPLNLTGIATETKVSADISVPANTLGDTSRIRFDAFNSCTATANGRYMIIRFGPTATSSDPIAVYINFGGNYGMHIVETLSCLNSSTVKKGLLSWTSGAISATPVLKNGGVTQSISVDNTVQNYITIWIKNGQTTDNSTIESLSIEVIP